MAEDVRGHDAMFGDGYFCVFKQIKSVLVDKVEKNEVRMKTTEQLRRVFHIKDSDLDKEFLLTKYYDPDDFFPLNLNPGSESWLMLCTFEGKPSDLMKKLDQKILAQRDFYKTLASSYKGQCIRLFYDLRMMMLYPKRFEKEIILRMTDYKKIIGTTEVLQQSRMVSPEDMGI